MHGSWLFVHNTTAWYCFSVFYGCSSFNSSGCRWRLHGFFYFLNKFQSSLPLNICIWDWCGEGRRGSNASVEIAKFQKFSTESLPTISPACLAIKSPGRIEIFSPLPARSCKTLTRPARAGIWELLPAPPDPRPATLFPSHTCTCHCVVRLETTKHSRSAFHC